jgi:hypothetical protein
MAHTHRTVSCGRVASLRCARCQRRVAGYEEAVRRFPSLLTLIYLGIGVAIAAERHYFENVHGVKGVVAAVLAILLWPLLLLDLIAIKRR